MHFTRQRRPGNQRIKCPLGQPQMSVGAVMQYQPGGCHRANTAWPLAGGAQRGMSSRRWPSHPADLESVLGASHRGFESRIHRILRQPLTRHYAAQKKPVPRPRRGQERGDRPLRVEALGPDLQPGGARPDHSDRPQAALPKEGYSIITPLQKPQRNPRDPNADWPSRAAPPKATIRAARTSDAAADGLVPRSISSMTGGRGCLVKARHPRPPAPPR